MTNQIGRSFCSSLLWGQFVLMLLASGCALDLDIENRGESSDHNYGNVYLTHEVPVQSMFHQCVGTESCTGQIDVRVLSPTVCGAGEVDFACLTGGLTDHSTDIDVMDVTIRRLANSADQNGLLENNRAVRVASLAPRIQDNFVETPEDAWQTIHFEIPAGENIEIDFSKLLGVDEVNLTVDVKIRPKGPGDGPKDVFALLDFMDAQQGLRYFEIPCKREDSRSYRVSLDGQYLDHNDPSKGSFRQHMILNHKSNDEPMVLFTQGYNLSENRILDVTELLGANQLQVENRFHGRSKTSNVPDDYEFLVPNQIANDIHNVVQLFKGFYQKPWISSGGSKSGVSALFHHGAFPGDVVATLATVTPLNHELDGAKKFEFLDAVGSEQCRTKVRKFQNRALTLSEEVLPLVLEKRHRPSYTYDLINGREHGSLEFFVVYFEWMFWRRKGIEHCPMLSNVAEMSAEEVALLLMDVMGGWLHDGSFLYAHRPFRYEMSKYFGSLNLYEHHLRDALQYSNDVHSVTDHSKPTFDADYLIELRKWAEHDATDIAFIYGEYDPWTASKVDVFKNPSLLEKTVPQGNHNVTLMDLPQSERDEVLDYLRARF